MVAMSHVQWSIILAVVSTAVNGWPDAPLDSREFKTMIDVNLFRDVAPCQSDISHVTQAIDLELTMAAQSVNATKDGSFSLKKGMPRIVEFYDTPGHCLLKKNNWIFRRRQEENDKEWEGTLKSRSGDLYHSAQRRKHMNECCKDCEDLGGKFEEDLNLQWNSQFSYSHKCQMTRQSDEINNLKDISNHWVEMEGEFSALEWPLDMTVGKVGDLSVVECVYKGLSFDFGEKEDAQSGKFSLTLWYEESTQRSPSLAELSFTIKRPSKKKDWAKSTIMAVHGFWEQVKGLTSVDWGSAGKTEWVYKFHLDFCCDE